MEHAQTDRRLRRFGTKASSVALALALLAPMCAPVAAFAVPGQAPSQTPASLEEQVLQFESRIASLDTNLEIISEEINTAHEDLKSVRAEIARREQNLEKARNEYQQSRDILAEQAAAAYREGTATYLEILFSAEDISSLLSKYDFINRSMDMQEQVQNELKTQKEAIETELVDLKKDELDAQAIEFDLAAKKIEMKHRKAEYQKMFDDAQEQVREGYRARGAQQGIVDKKTLAEFLAGGYEVVEGGVVETALAYRGIPYKWGGESKKGFDCSGLVLYVFAQHGVSLPHSSRVQATMGTPVPVNQLQPGDAVFFGSPVHHVGIYIGGKYYIHAPRTGDVVKVAVLSTRGDYVGARRYGWVPRTGDPR